MVSSLTWIRRKWGMETFLTRVLSRNPMEPRNHEVLAGGVERFYQNEVSSFRAVESRFSPSFLGQPTRSMR
jgi:hypothetical protein